MNAVVTIKSGATKTAKPSFDFLSKIFTKSMQDRKWERRNQRESVSAFLLAFETVSRQFQNMAFVSLTPMVVERLERIGFSKFTDDIGTVFYNQNQNIALTLVDASEWKNLNNAIDIAEKCRANLLEEEEIFRTAYSVLTENVKKITK